MTTATAARAPAKSTRLYAGGQRIHLDPPIGAGREGTVHPVNGQPLLAAKLISPNNPNPQQTAAKLAVMANTLTSPKPTRHHLITWPKAIISRRKTYPEATGYTMTRLDTTVYHQLGSYFNPLRRRKLLADRHTGYSYLHLLTIARNLALAVHQAHSHGVLIGDLNSRNVLANDQGRVAIIDTDSFQVTDPTTGVTYPCLVGTPEYTPPNLQGREFANTTRTKDDDLFSLAVMLYQLLTQGTHPYAGTTAADPSQPNDIASRIAAGHLAFQKTSKGQEPPANITIIWQDLPLKRHFKTAFQNHRPRTTAKTWAQAITKTAQNLKQCPKNSLHRHFTKRCTWCRYQALTRIDPFPRPSKTPPKKPSETTAKTLFNMPPPTRAPRQRKT